MKSYESESVKLWIPLVFRAVFWPPGWNMANFGKGRSSREIPLILVRNGRNLVISSVSSTLWTRFPALWNPSWKQSICSSSPESQGDWGDKGGGAGVGDTGGRRSVDLDSCSHEVITSHYAIQVTWRRQQGKWIICYGGGWKRHQTFQLQKQKREKDLNAAYKLQWPGIKEDVIKTGYSEHP